MDRPVIYGVTEIFRSLQGEGHFVGYPMTFVRLAGCSVKDCAIRSECDEAPWSENERLDANGIYLRCWQIEKRGIVCITGGEPTDYDLIPLVDTLTKAGHRVHMETSGARPVTGIPIEWLTVSPKTPDYKQRVGHTLKIVVRPGMIWRDILAYDEGANFFHRYLQPLTESDGSTNLAQVHDLIADGFNGDARWALSTQAHKVWRVA